MAEWTYTITLAIPNDDQTRFLLLPDGEQWTGPRFTLRGGFGHLYMLSRQIHEQMGAEMVVLRTLARQMDAETYIVRVLWLMDNLTQNWQPPKDVRWVDRVGLERIMLVDEWMRPAIETALDTLNEAPPAARPLWFQRGWFAQASAWTQEVLAAKGYTLLHQPEQFKLGSISSVLRAETTTGMVFFKVAVALPLFGNEPQLCAALGELYPDVIQAPLAIDAARRWMLTVDIGTELYDSERSIEIMQKVAQTYARLQIASASQLDILFAAGCLDRRLNVLESQIDNLLADEAPYSAMNEEERAAWRASGDQLKALCKQLAGYNIPYTLSHGDFHSGNIALEGDRIRFFDWTDACVAHPFFDMIVLMDFDKPEEAAVLRDAYLAEWTAYEPLERLLEAYPIALILGALHQAVSYRGIFNGVEEDQRAGWIFGVPTFARYIIQHLKEVSD